VVTDLTFLPTLVGDTGRVVPVRDPVALASEIRALLEAPVDALRALGARARERIVEKFSLRAMVVEYEQIYRELFEAQAARASRSFTKEAIN
jgi:glycosyltransferase involved in cell wall biosynthesis